MAEPRRRPLLTLIVPLRWWGEDIVTIALLDLRFSEPLRLALWLIVMTPRLLS